MSPLVVNVIPAKDPELELWANAPGDTVGVVATELGGTGGPAGAPSPPKALATATGRDVKPC